MADVKKAIEAEEYQKAISLSSKYLPTGNSQLSALNSQAKKEQADKQKTEKTNNLLAKLKSIPESGYEQNKNLYQQLASLHPSNTNYATKLKYYTQKVTEEKEKQWLAAERKKKIESQFSAWDGFHRNLERVIKESMNDPGSYDHAKTVYWDMGDHLVVRTTFRGKNAFGGIVKNSVKAKVSLDGQVLQIME